jgi:hypothetical protein
VFNLVFLGFLKRLKPIKRVGAVEMGLAASTSAAALVRGTPKIAVLYAPTSSNNLTKDAQIRVQSFSMGKPHLSLQLTGAACVAAATSIEGTIAHRLSNSLSKLMLPTPERTPSPGAAAGALDFPHTNGLASSDQQQRVEKQVAITHSKGLISVKVALSRFAEEVHVERCELSRTARRILQIFQKVPATLSAPRVNTNLKNNLNLLIPPITLCVKDVLPFCGVPHDIRGTCIISYLTTHASDHPVGSLTFAALLSCNQNRNKC